MALPTRRQALIYTTYLHVGCNKAGDGATYISTLSTLTPQGSVASSKELCMLWEMLSLSLKISAKFFVPKTFLRVVAASKRVEWLWGEAASVGQRGRGKHGVLST